MSTVKRKNNIGEMTWVEVKDALEKDGIDTVIFPAGAIEQHGPHGVFGTDSFLAQLVAENLAIRLNALIAPLMPYGLSSSHMNFKGTISLTPETFTMIARDVLSSLIHHGFKKIVVMNGNEPNYYPFIMVARTLREETGVTITVSNWFSALQETWKELPGVKGTERANWKWPYFMAHGGILETSGTMAYKSGIVRLDLATIYGSEKREIFSNSTVSLPARIDEVAPKGSYGDPRESSEELGKMWIDAASTRIEEKIRAAWAALAKSS